jgi:hypothetical protein
VRYLDQSIATGFRGVHRFDYPAQRWLNQTPSVSAEDNNRNLSPGEILLVDEILIDCQQKVEPSFLGNAQQISIEQSAPSLLVSGSHDMARKKVAYCDRRALVE